MGESSECVDREEDINIEDFKEVFGNWKTSISLDNFEKQPATWRCPKGFDPVPIKLKPYLRDIRIT